MLNKNKKDNLIKLGELSVAGAVLVGLNVGTNVQKTAKAADNVDKTSEKESTQTLNTNALTRMMNKNTGTKRFAVSKLASASNNGGFDASWGTLNTQDWKGHVQGNYFVLDKYVGTSDKIIIPNAADLQAAGINTQGKQVGVTSEFMHDVMRGISNPSDNPNTPDSQPEAKSIAFSNTNGNKVKAIGSNWKGTFEYQDINDSDFIQKSSLSQFDGSGLDVSGITNMANMFCNTALTSTSGLSNWDTSNVTNMSNMFAFTTELTDLSGLQNWDTSNVTDMHDMFDNTVEYRGGKLTNLQPLAKWNVSNVTNMQDMFAGQKLSNLNGLQNWNVSNVTDMNHMFYNNSLSDLTALKDWKPSHAKDMSEMFATGGQANLLQHNPDNTLTTLNGLQNWNVSSVQNMRSMFSGNTALTDISALKNWDVSNVTNMSGMFYVLFLESGKLEDLTPLANWNVSNVKDMSWMFTNNKVSDLTPLSNWNTGNVTDMYEMFESDHGGVSDLTPIKNWDTSNTAIMADMFLGNPIKKADFSKWNFGKILKQYNDENLHKNVTGLYGFIPSNVYSVINLRDNKTLPSWFMDPNADGKDTNLNIFTAGNGNNIVLTNDSSLLANPNKEFNKLSFDVAVNTSSVDTPVFIDSTFDKIMSDAQDIQKSEVDKQKQQHPGYNFVATRLQDDPIAVLNTDFTARKNRTIKVQFRDMYLHMGGQPDVILKDTQTLNEPDNDGTVDYSKVNDTVKQLQDKGYDVSNITANKPDKILASWDNFDNTQNVSNDAYSVQNDNGNITITYNVSHRTVKVSHNDPKTTNDVVEGTNIHYPKGVSQSDLNTEHDIPLSYFNEDHHKGSSYPVLKKETAHVTQSKDATVDLVTGDVEYSNEQDGSITAIAPHGFMIDTQSTVLPKIPGYTLKWSGSDRFINSATLREPNESIIKAYETLFHSDGVPVMCTGIDTPASIAVKDNHGNNLDKYAVQTHGHYGSVVDWNGTNTPDKINNIVKQMEADGYTVDTSSLNPDQFKDTEYSDDTKAKPITTIIGSERTVKVTHDLPKTPSDIIDGTNKHYPAGVDKDSLNKTITRTITLKKEDGTNMKDPIVQTVHMHRDATVNAVTGAVSYTDWTPDGSFDSVQIPKVDGYTPDKTTVEKIDNPQLGKDYNESVVYTRNDEDSSITYIDDTTGKVLKSESIKPKFGDPIKFATNPSDYIKQLESKGYDLVSNDYKDGATASTDPTKNKFTVHVKHHLTNVERTKDVHEHINYNVTDNNGKTSTESDKNSPVLHFKQTGVKDAVTGQTDWNGKLDSQTFSSVDTAKKPGYVADVQTIPSKTVTLTNDNWDKNHDINTTVNYKPAEESVKVVIKDENGKTIQTIVKTGKYGEDYDFTGDKAPKIDGYTFEKASDNAKGKFDVNNKDIILTYKKNETKKPAVVPPVKHTPNDTSVFKQNIAEQKQDDNLPEMAENKSDLAVAGIGIATLAGLTGLAGVQIKKRRA